MHNQPNPGFPPQGGSFPPQGGGFPPQGGSFPPQGGGFPQRPMPYQPYRPPQPGGTNGMSVAALVMGIIATVGGLFFGWLMWPAIATLILGILALIFGLRGGRESSNGQATAGLVMGIIGGVISLGWLAMWAMVVHAGFQFLNMWEDEVFDEAFDEALEAGAWAGSGARLGDERAPYQPYDRGGAPNFEEIRGQVYEVDGLVITDVEVLSDNFDDFLIRADVAHVGDRERNYALHGVIYRDGVEVGTVDESGRLGPGDEVEVHLSGISNFDRDYDEVVFELSRQPSAPSAMDETLVPGNRLGDERARYQPYDRDGAPNFEDIRGEEYEVDDLVITDVEVLSDSASDFLIRADVEHVGDQEGSYDLQGVIYRDGAEMGTVDESGMLAPGDEVEVHLTGFSDFVRDYDEVEFRIGSSLADLSGLAEQRLGDERARFQPYDRDGAPNFEEIRGEAYEVGDLRVTDVEVLSDSYSDFLIRADVEHVGEQEGSYDLQGAIYRDGAEVGTVDESGRLGPGDEVEVHLTGISDFVRDYDEVRFEVSPL